jgi:hypothetical protein
VIRVQLKVQINELSSVPVVINDLGFSKIYILILLLFYLRCKSISFLFFLLNVHVRGHSSWIFLVVSSLYRKLENKNVSYPYTNMQFGKDKAREGAGTSQGGNCAV